MKAMRSTCLGYVDNRHHLHADKQEQLLAFYMHHRLLDIGGEVGIEIHASI